MIHDVYEYKATVGGMFFSDGVKREFGENKIVFTEDRGEIFSCVMPLNSTDGLILVGHCYSVFED